MTDIDEMTEKEKAEYNEAYKETFSYAIEQLNLRIRNLGVVIEKEIIKTYKGLKLLFYGIDK